MDTVVTIVLSHNGTSKVAGGGWGTRTQILSPAGRFAVKGKNR